MMLAIAGVAGKIGKQSPSGWSRRSGKAIINTGQAQAAAIAGLRAWQPCRSTIFTCIQAGAKRGAFENCCFALNFNVIAPGKSAKAIDNAGHEHILKLDQLLSGCGE